MFKKMMEKGWLSTLILAVLLGLLLTQCTGDGDATQSTPAQTVGYIGEAEDYDLYWNLDKALYTENSDVGLSTRERAEDGLYHFRFASGGKLLELTTGDAQMVNYLDTMDMMEEYIIVIM